MTKERGYYCLGVRGTFAHAMRAVRSCVLGQLSTDSCVSVPSNAGERSRSRNVIGGFQIRLRELNTTRSLRHTRSSGPGVYSLGGVSGLIHLSRSSIYC
jgi:hypothetical protein